MAVNPFILLPLYIYPEPGLWDPLFTAAAAHPNVNFQVVVNPWNGPGAESCPDAAFQAVLQQAATHANIRTLGYVHTADRYDCGPSGDLICVTSAPLADVQANVTRYRDWGRAECGGRSVDGIFFDEAPATAAAGQVEYMRAAASFAAATLAGDATTVFNAGTAVAADYWPLADYVVVLEGSEAQFRAAQGDGAVGAAGRADQSVFIVYGYASGSEQLRADVEGTLGSGTAGLAVTDADGYTRFGGNWLDFVDVVDEVVNGRSS